MKVAPFMASMAFWESTGAQGCQKRGEGFDLRQGRLIHNTIKNWFGFGECLCFILLLVLYKSVALDETSSPVEGQVHVLNFAEIREFVVQI